MYGVRYKLCLTKIFYLEHEEHKDVLEPERDINDAG